MQTCNHADFDEYFGVCTNCKATRKEVLQEEFKDELKPVYAKLQDALGLPGDIAPETLAQLETAENALAEVVATWLDDQFNQ
jgi:hypothetical protein